MSEQIPSKQFCALVAGKADAKRRASDAMSFIKGKLKSASEDANLDLKAMTAIEKALPMNEDRRNAYFDAIALYRDYMDENNAWPDGQHMGNLVDMAEKKQPSANDDAPDPDAEAAAANAKKIKRGIKQVDPAAAGAALTELADTAPVH